MSLPPVLQSKILKKIEREIDQQIEQLGGKVGQSRSSQLLSWFGRNALGIGTLIAVFTLLSTIYNNEAVRAATEAARIAQDRLASAQALKIEQQRREARFLGLVERTSEMIRNDPTRYYYSILSNLRELRDYAIQNPEQGASLALLATPILTSEEMLGTPLYRMASHAFATGVEHISRLEFAMFFSEWSKFFERTIAKGNTKSDEVLRDFTRLICTLAYVQTRLDGKGFTENCPSSKEVFSKD